MPRSVFLPALLLALSPLVVGCGGDDEEEGGTAQPEPLSKADFVEQANKICADGNAEIEAAAQDLPDEPTEEQVTQFSEDVLLPNIQGQHDAIADLGAPEGDEDEVTAILEALQEGLDVVEEDPSTLLSDEDPLGEASDLAEDYGLADCAV